MKNIGTTATSVKPGRVTYHGTDVVTWDNDTITLNTGGWFTVTTKARMNQTASQFNLGFTVYQKARVWYINFQGNIITFTDITITLHRREVTP
jgi:hypothetical protein